jgi:uncharacterized membrane protein
MYLFYYISFFYIDYSIKKPMNHPYLYFIFVFFSILILDGLWINLFFKHRFFPMIETIQKSPVVINPYYVVIAYFILIALVYILIPKCSSAAEAFLIGFLVYAVYDSTNLATLTDWNLLNAIIDSLWGGILFMIIYILYEKLFLLNPVISRP